VKKLIAVAAVAAAFCSAFAEMKLGIVGCDTSHTIAFTKLFNVEKDPDLKGHRVAVAYKWGSRDIVSSTNRYPEYIPQMKEMGVEMVGSIKELVEKCDAVLIETNDGRPHYGQAFEVFKSGKIKRVFIDKPVAASFEDAKKIAEAAKKHGVKFFCSSALRYTDNAQKARKGEFGPIRAADCWTPISFEPTQSDYYWYGIHAAEPLFTIMGTGCTEVTATRNGIDDVLVGRWADGRIGVMRGMRQTVPGGRYGGIIIPQKGKMIDMGGYEGYKKLLVQIVKFFETGDVPVSPEETLEIYAFLEAGAESVRRGGTPVKLSEYLKK
jgi:hypothetical protein